MKFYTVRPLGNKPRREFQTLSEVREWVARKQAQRAQSGKTGNPYRILECDGAEPVSRGVVRDFPGVDVS